MEINECCFNIRGTKKKACWRLTTACNLNCRHCFAHRGDCTVSPVDSFKLRSIMNLLHRRNVEYLIISGGEPLLHPDLNDIIGESISEGFIISISTNAIDIDSKRAEQLYSIGLRKATVSLDGYNKVTSTFLRRNPEAYGLALRGIEFLMDSGINVTVNVVLSPSLSGYLSDLVHIVEPLGVRRVSFTFPVCRGENRLIQWQQKVGQLKDSFVREVKNLEFSRTCKSEIVLNMPKCNLDVCPAGIEILGINENGEEVNCLVKEWLAANKSIIHSNYVQNAIR